MVKETLPMCFHLHRELNLGHLDYIPRALSTQPQGLCVCVCARARTRDHIPRKTGNKLEMNNESGGAPYEWILLQYKPR